MPNPYSTRYARQVAQADEFKRHTSPAALRLGQKNAEA